MKKVVVASSSGIANSEAVASKLRHMCHSAELDVNIKTVPAENLESALADCDVYVTMVPPGSQKWGKPVVNGVPFLTGFEMDEEFSKLKRLLQ